VIKEYFSNYFLYNSDITFDFRNGNNMQIHNNTAEDWRITLVDTGLETMTGGRLKRVKKYVGNETFMLTYGDGVSDVNINALLEFHKSHGKLATLTTVQPEGRFGVLDIKNNQINSFREKSEADVNFVNGGFMVFEPEIFNYIKDDTTFLEREPLERLAKEGQLMAYAHEGFWQCMDTQRDKQKLEKLWISGQAPWKVW